MPTIEQLNAMIEEATQALPDTVTSATDLGSLDGWDSMGLVIFIDLVQTQVGIEIAVHDLRACSHSHEVLAMIERALAG